MQQDYNNRMEMAPVHFEKSADDNIDPSEVKEPTQPNYTSQKVEQDFWVLKGHEMDW